MIRHQTIEGGKAKSLARRPVFALLVPMAMSCGGVGEDAVSTEGTTASRRAAIVNGTPSDQAEALGIVRIDIGSGLCTGTVIDNQWVVSAAHCFDSDPRKSATISMGAQLTSAAEIFIHPNLDVALIRTADPLTVGGQRTGFVRRLLHELPGGAIPNFSNVQCYGYGRSTFSGGSGTLRSATLQAFRYPYFDGPEVLRVAKNSAGQIPWEGDSGGTCFYQRAFNQEMIGVASGVLATGTTLNQAEYVTPHAFRSWVGEIMIEHELIASHTVRCLDVWGGSRAGGAIVQQYGCHGGANQRWRFEPRGGGQYLIRAVHSGHCLDVRGASHANLAQIQQYPCHDGPNQRWRLEQLDGAFRIRAVHSGKCLELPSNSINNGVRLVQSTCHSGYSQRFVARAHLNGGEHELASIRSDRCISIPPSIGQQSVHDLWQFDCARKQVQLWRLRDDRRDGWHTAQSISSHECIGVSTGTHGNGAAVQSYWCGGQTSQRVRLYRIGAGYELRLAHSGKCVSLAGWSPANGVAIQQWPCNHYGSNQQWRLSL